MDPEVAAALAGHLGTAPGFIDEDQATYLEPHHGLAFEPPFATGLANIGTIFLTGRQRIYLKASC